MDRNTRYDAYDIPVGLIWADDDFNCRRRFSIESVQELADNIGANGLEFPIVVQPAVEVESCPMQFDFRLVAGFRRLKAISQLLGWRTIPATIREGLTEEQARLLNLTENLQRKDLNKLEEAKAIEALFDADLSDREVGRIVSRTPGWVNVRRSLLQMPDRVQEKVAAGMFSLADVRYVAKHDPTQWDKLIARCENKRASRNNPVVKHKRKAKTKDQIKTMLAGLRNRGVDGLPLMVLCWAIGEVDEHDVWNKVEKHLEDADCAWRYRDLMD